MAALSQSSQTGQDPTHHPVPTEARMGRLSLTMAWWAVCSAMFYIVVGASLALSYGARNALLGMALSVISYGLVNAVLSRFAIRSGLSVALFSRLLFGSTGACLATLIFFSTAIYYAVFEGSVIAVAFNHMYPQLAYPLAALIVVLYSVPLILGSVQHWLDKLNGVLLPVYLGGLAGRCFAVDQPIWLSAAMAGIRSGNARCFWLVGLFCGVYGGVDIDDVHL